MSAREWKPGDVARTKAGGTVARTATNRWVLLYDGHDIDIEDDRISRPLAVIDPEDRSQVDRLVALFESQRGESMFSKDDAHMQAALREFADPKPRIEEPTGLGAVVEDADGQRWVRMTDYEGANWHRWNAPDDVRPWRFFRDIDVVRILSEGVTA